MLHEPSVELAKDFSVEKKAKLGAILFCVYFAVYSGFVVIGTLSPKTLGMKFLGDTNLAIVYGMGLIILAIVMGLVYNYFCTRFEDKMNAEVKS